MPKGLENLKFAEGVDNPFEDESLFGGKFVEYEDVEVDEDEGEGQEDDDDDEDEEEEDDEDDDNEFKG